MRPTTPLPWPPPSPGVPGPFRIPPDSWVMRRSWAGAHARRLRGEPSRPRAVVLAFPLPAAVAVEDAGVARIATQKTRARGRGTP
jgi:hypothetical protein